MARERQKQIPFGDDNKKATAEWLVDGLHPTTHGKVRDRWGTRFVFAGDENRDRSRSPSGMTTKKQRLGGW
jgi:hypothetical protein